MAAAGVAGQGFGLGTSVFGVAVPFPRVLQRVFAKREALSHENE